MSARGAAGAFLLGILAGVVISEAVSRATRPAGAGTMPPGPAPALPVPLDTAPSGVAAGPDPHPHRDARSVRRKSRRQAGAADALMLRVTRTARRIGHGMAFGIGFALALAARALGRLGELPAMLRTVPQQPGPVVTFGRVLPGRTLAISVRMHPLRGGPVGRALDARPGPLALRGTGVPV